MSTNRKDDHLRLAQAQSRDLPSDFDLIEFVHDALPQCGLADVSLHTTLFGHEFGFPLYINAMTGGSDKAAEINRDLAQVARICGLPLALGSMSSVFKRPATATSYTVVREEYRDGFLLANLSANASVEQARTAIQLIAADALQIHVNAAQEIVMTEGDRDFSGWLDNIRAIRDAVDVPVIVKEVGFGMSSHTMKQLKAAGIEHIDVGGKGGTNFIWIENQRRSQPTFDYLETFGQSAVTSLRALYPAAGVNLYASGGIRNPLDAVKSLALGAQGVGLAGLVLRAMKQDGVDGAAAYLEQWLEHMKLILLLLGCRTIEDLRYKSLLISPLLEKNVYNPLK